MLLVLMYHRVSDPNFTVGVAEFKQHLLQLCANYHITTPGEPLHNSKLSICLTFDDAYYDFYHDVFPLLQQLNIKAVLGIPTKYIVASTTLAARARLTVPYPTGMEDNLYNTRVPFCTWDEIKTMVASGQVIAASHSHSHADLTDPATCLTQECLDSKNMLEQQLQIPINTFIYPYGKMNRTIHSQVAKYYDYVMRIGSAGNKNWLHPDKLIYRVDADYFWKYSRTISKTQLATYQIKYLLNRLRFK
ncbi:MAG: hypothetical protein COB50_01565 [Thiotrichales bacterium]|nr:MAG: hypothetical protein COB50_01565 [Thiotrichales bacterium]